MAKVTLNMPRRLRGTATVPGDKSISHRAIILNSLATGQAVIDNFLTGADCLSTVACMQALGVPIERTGAVVTITGVGLAGLREPLNVLDCGNSGTTIRLLVGVLAGQPLFAVLSGDSSLNRRPQRRVVEPLRQLGAHVDGRDNGQFAPLAVHGARLQGGTYALPVASAQVKSALLLAALSGTGPLRLTGLLDSRDHTERMLRAMGVAISVDPTTILLEPPALAADPTVPHPLSLRVPGDPSSAAFWWVAAAIHPKAQITTPDVCLNPTRTGALDVLRAMGANISITDEREEGSEPVGTVTVRSSQLRGTTIGGALIPRLIDELPVLAVAAACAEGETTVCDAHELRVKETDRIHTVVTGLHALGVQAEATADGFVVAGGAGGILRGALLSSHGDHRLAMAWAVAALVARPETTIADADAVQISYPSFWETLATLAENH